MRPTNPSPPGSNALSRRSFLIAGAAAGVAVGLSLPSALPATAGPAEQAVVAAERPHNTLLGVL